VGFRLRIDTASSAADDGGVAEPFTGTASSSVFGRNVDDRYRMQYQFELMREDFLAWFEVALRRAGLTMDPNLATWSVLDVGCGEGQYALEIARRYPRTTVVGVDVNTGALHTARTQSAGQPNLRFATYDIREPMRSDVVPDSGFDVVVSWMVLLHLPEKAAALSHLAAVLRPGGGLLLGNTADEPVRLDQPDALRLAAVGERAVRQLGMGGLERDLEPMLRQTGFHEIDSVVLRYAAGGATAGGQRWHRYALSTFRASRRLLVDIGRLMDGAEFDRRLDALHRTPVLDVSGEVRFVVTVARRC
jgi:2-polyprenyl-3-methyl-5-hydroxy-6-metoxy-1,4-benzoquinol methylase